MLDTNCLIKKAGRFAAALDACDYAGAAKFLTPDCRYHVSAGDVRVGPEAILASYQESDATARRHFDRVEYTSDASLDESGRIRLTFFDNLYCGSASHTYQCAQIVYFDESELIERIELVEIPGERDRLNAFCAAHRIQLH